MSKRKKSLDENFFVRYKNRKLYSWATSSYVTLDYLYSKLENGHEVMIIDRQTDEDITGISLAREAVTYYSQKMKLAPTLGQVKELINLIKTWERKETLTSVAAKKATNGSNDQKGDKIKEEKNRKNHIEQETEYVTNHEVILPFGVGNIKNLNENSPQEVNKTMQDTV